MKIWNSVTIFSLILNLPFEIVSAGDHWDLRISKQMLPLELMLG